MVPYGSGSGSIWFRLVPSGSVWFRLVALLGRSISIEDEKIPPSRRMGCGQSAESAKEYVQLLCHHQDLFLPFRSNSSVFCCISLPRGYVAYSVRCKKFQLGTPSDIGGLSKEPRASTGMKSSSHGLHVKLAADGLAKARFWRFGGLK